MRLEAYRENVAKLGREVRFLRMALLVVGLVALVMSLLVAFGGKSVRVEVIHPPGTGKDFWVSTEGFDKSYLEQMGVFLGYALLSVTPETVDAQARMVLPLLDPRMRGPFKARAMAMRKRLSEHGMSLAFHPKQVWVGKKDCRIRVDGELTILVGSAQARRKPVSLHVDCVSRNGRFYVTRMDYDDRLAR
ncbi:MAG: hypothetical protein D6760_02220 [Deltaproteobacteria bacterium]|nr:MAG: hypothetical protein D6760_02220 [Deltaproteobacteria bacterium]